MTTTEIPVEHTDGVPVDLVPEQVTVDTASDDTVELPPGVELRFVDPNDLIIGLNTRTAPKALPKWFLDDIKERGVREAIAVREDELGRLVVRKGQRRTRAAVEAWAWAKEKKIKPRLVKVLVEPELITDEAQRRIDEIIDQLGENEHREAISDADEVRATQELLNLGLTAGQIARKRHIGTKRVKTAVDVARSDVAMDLLSSGAIEDLTVAAVIADFTGDDEAVEELTKTANKRPEQFEHVAQQRRDKRDESRIRAEISAQFTEQGVTVVDRPASLHDGQARKLDNLRPTAQSPSGTELTLEEHKDCAGHAAFVGNLGHWKPIAERFGAVYICTDFKAHGHSARYDGSSVTAIKGPMTDEQKAERKLVVANNKAWRSAETVRRKWLKGFLGRKSSPKDGIRWVAQMLAEGSHPVRKAMETDHELAIELMGLPKPQVSSYHRRDKHAIAVAAENASAARATTLMVALLVGAMEKSVGTHTWRGPSTEAKAYFTRLQDWGYTLSDVEKLVIDPEGKATAAIEVDEADLDDQEADVEEPDLAEDTAPVDIDTEEQTGAEPDAETDEFSTDLAA